MNTKPNIEYARECAITKHLPDQALTCSVVVIMREDLERIMYEMFHEGADYALETAADVIARFEQRTGNPSQTSTG